MPLIISKEEIKTEAKILLVEQAEILFEPALKHEFGLGELVIAEDAFYWKNDKVFLTVDYPSIIMHAIQKGENESERGFVYCQLSSSVLINESGELSNNKEEETEQVTIEMKIIPESCSALTGIFNALSECAELHPDEEQFEFDDSEWITSENVDQFVASKEQLSALQHLDSLFNEKINENGKRVENCEDTNEVKEARFEDADR